MKKSQDIILNGSAQAKKILKNQKSKIKNQKSKICLVVILIGKNPASQVYIKIKERRAKEIGVNFKKYLLPASVSEKKVLDLINKLNNNENIHGILVQLPLPKKFNTQKIIQKINPEKDVDGLLTPPSPSLKRRGVISPTIQSILCLIKISNKKLAGKKAIILANSLEFAKPLKKELEEKRIKVRILLKSKITNYELRITNYDIIIIAFGERHWLKPEMIKKNAVVIDVGINRDNTVKSLRSHGARNSKKIFGDVHPDCFKKSKYISPVPGGVGPLTVAFLFKNLVKLVSKK